MKYNIDIFHCTGEPLLVTDITYKGAEGLAIQVLFEIK